MKTLTILAASAAAFVSLSTTQTVGDCQNGVYIIIARGSYETPPEGQLSVLADRLVERIPESDSVGIGYPATISEPTYFTSQPEGVGNLTRFLEEYGDKCPSTKLVLMGYSQGAHVIGDTLIGAQVAGFPRNTPLDAKYLPSIAAIILMGDPSFALNFSINVGNATTGGLFRRPNNDQWTARGLVSRVRSYCDFNDTYCDSGSSGVVHAGYIPEYGTAALDFVVARVGEAGQNSSSSSSSAAGGSSTMSTGMSSSSSVVESLSTSSSSAMSPTAGSDGGTSSSSATPAPTGAASGRRSDGAGLFALAGLLAAGVAFVL